LRQLSAVTFLILRDGKGTAQVIIDNPTLVDLVSRLHHESVLQVDGIVVAEPQAPGGLEVRNATITVLVPALAPTPVDLFRPTIAAQLPTILDHAPLTLRHPRHRALARLGAASMAGFRSTLSRLDFVEVQTPKIVAAATESGANVFAVDYFGQRAYLAQSPQFYKQIMVGVFERVFEVGPAFRAEPHDTPRHLNEYVSLDAEVGFIENHHTVMEILRQVLEGMVKSVSSEAADVVPLLEISIPMVPSSIPVLHFQEAMNLIFSETREDGRDESDLAPTHERWLGEWAQRTHGSEFLFIVGYPMVKRPFYTHPDPQQPAFSNSFDLLFRGVEVVTGGQRLHHYGDYLAALRARGLDPAPFTSYLEVFRYGMPPHGGFAIGLERWVAQLAGVPNVRLTTLFPRDRNRLTP
jgi:nondiscriminating aspartyl-tRNA synthetase